MIVSYHLPTPPPYLPVHVSVYPCNYLVIHVSVYSCVYFTVYMPIHDLFHCLYAYPCIYFTVYPCTQFSLCLFMYLYISLSVYSCICIFHYLSIHVSVYFTICLFMYLSILLSIYLYLFICPSIYSPIVLSTFFSQSLYHIQITRINTVDPKRRETFAKRACISS